MDHFSHLRCDALSLSFFLFFPKEFYDTNSPLDVIAVHCMFAKTNRCRTNIREEEGIHMH